MSDYNTMYDMDWFTPGPDDVEGPTPLKWAANAEDELASRSLRYMRDEEGEVYVNRIDLVHFLRSCIKLQFSGQVVTMGGDMETYHHILESLVGVQASLAANFALFTDPEYEPEGNRLIPVSENLSVPDFVPDFLPDLTQEE